MSRGQTLYREFTKAINTLIKQIKFAIKSDENYETSIVKSWFDELLEEFENTLSDEQLDIEFWMEKATKYSEDKFSSIEDLLTLIEEDEPETEETNDVIEFPEITEEECRAETPGLPGNGKGVPRNIVLLTTEEVKEYAKGIPFELIKGFIPVYNKNGDLKGWKPCILSDTW